jgi:hypothetical protein
MTVTAPGSVPMTIDRTQAGHQTRYVLRYGGTESCMLTYGAAEIGPALWKILLPGPGGTDAIYGTEQFLSPDAGRLRSWLASVVGDDRAAGLTGAVDAQPPAASGWTRNSSPGALRIPESRPEST